MKNKLAKLFAVISLFFVLTLFSAVHVHANEMSFIEYEIELQPDGSGIVTETRQMYLTRDTEIYIVFDNLAGSEIIDIQVSDFGKPLTYEPDWDIYASREEKAGKFGVVNIDGGGELCWGIGEYGEHQFTVTYTIKDMVRQLADGQSMNWKLFDGRDNINPEEVNIRISGPVTFSGDNTQIWGFGFDGEVYLEDGQLVGWSNESLSDSNHITILMHFLDQPFNLNLSLDQTLNEQRDHAFKNSSYDNSLSREDTIFLFSVVGGMLLIISIIISYQIIRHRAIKRNNPLVKGKKREKINEDQYYREVPYQAGPISDIAYLLQEVKMGSVSDYFNAYMLKWLKERRMTIMTEEAGRFWKRERTTITLDLNGSFDSEFEQRYWDFLTSGADENGVIDNEKLKTYARVEYKTIRKIEKELTSESKEHLIKTGYLTETVTVFLGFFGAEVVQGTERGETLFNQLVQFKNYLDDFSLLSEREMKEVALWDDLLIWASLFGIAEEVTEQLKNFYPTYFEETHIPYRHVYLMNSFSKDMSRGYNVATGGGGGSTSVGGGGGSFGGGGGGSR